MRRATDSVRTPASPRRTRGFHLLGSLVILSLLLGTSSTIHTSSSGSALAQQGTPRPSPAGHSGVGRNSMISGAPTPQGPALVVPREIMLMLEQRDRALDVREKTLHAESARLITLKDDVQALLNRHTRATQVAGEKAKEQERRRLADEARLKRREERIKAETKKLTAVQEVRDEKLTARLKKVAKMYEAMPPEEAATRIQQLPQGTAVKVLLLIKSRAAGNILAEVSPRQAAKLTERYLSNK